MIEEDAPKTSLSSRFLLRSTQVNVVAGQAELIVRDRYNVVKTVRPNGLLMKRNCVKIERKRIETGSNTKRSKDERLSDRMS